MYLNKEFAHQIGKKFYHYIRMHGKQNTVAYREGGLEGLTPPRNSEGPPKSCQTQPDCENC